MDKNAEINAIIEKDGELVHLAPAAGKMPVHQNSGLWIFNWAQNWSRPASVERRISRYFEFYSISRLKTGRGIYRRADMDKSVEIQPGQCVFVSPGVRQYYGAAEHCSYVEDTVNFCGQAADMLRAGGVFRDGVHDLADDSVIGRIIEYASDPSDHGQLNAGFTLTRLIQNVYNEEFRRTNKEKYPELSQLLDMLRDGSAGSWNIEQMAAFCRMGVSAFRAHFKERTGMLPKLYCDRIRINQACADLRYSLLSIQEIAEKAGYPDPFHFTRRFTALTGVPPTEYRRRCCQ